MIEMGRPHIRRWRSCAPTESSDGRCGDQRLAGRRRGPDLCAAVRAGDEPRLPVQAQGGGRRSRRRHAPSAAQRNRSLSLQVVEHRLGHGGGGVRAARGRAHACPDLDRPGGARRRPRLPGGARRALLRLRARPSPVDRDRPGRGLAHLADADRRERRRSQVRLLARGDDRLRGASLSASACFWSSPT